MYKLILVYLILIISSGCIGEKNRLKDFQSDGCTLFPDSSQILNADWCECCFEHDVAYWQGGTEEERLKADAVLKECVIEKTGDEKLAKVIYNGVRFGGSPYFYNWYRWGYGWNYERKYGELTPEEKKMAESKLEKYFSSNPEYPCK